MDPDDKDFLLHLYDKLWDNINEKEATVWTFLSVYGAVIGLALGSATFKSIGIYGVFAALLLTYWAAHIVLNADWWSIRNRAMVSRIERRFPNARKGVIPTFYSGPRYTNQPLNGISLLVLMFIAYFLYLKTILTYFESDTIRSLSTLAQISLLQFVFVALAYNALAIEEGNLHDYFTTYDDLRKDDNGAPAALTATKSDQQELKDRWRLKRRPILGALCLATTLPVCLAVYRNKEVVKLFLTIPAVLFIGAALLFIWQSWDYYHSPFSENKEYSLRLSNKTKNKADWRARVVAILFFLSCSMLVVSGRVGPSPLPWSSSPPSSKSAEEELEQLKSDLAALQDKMSSLQDRVTGRPEYLQRAQAESSYLKMSDPRLPKVLNDVSYLEMQSARVGADITSLQHRLEQVETRRSSPKKP